jgi:hypothetical protein
MNQTVIVTEWGPAPWMDPTAFFIIRYFFTGSSIALSLYTYIENWNSADTGTWHAAQYFSYWGTHGTAIAFLVTWFPYYAGLIPVWAVDWFGNWARFHLQCMMTWVMIISLIFFLCPLHQSCPYLGFDTYTNKQLVALIRHIWSIVCLYIDFSLSAMRFAGWNTWLNFGMCVWS